MRISTEARTLFLSTSPDAMASEIPTAQRVMVKAGTRFDRCRPGCCPDPNETLRGMYCDCASGKCERDSRSDAARRLYAVRMTEALTGAMDESGFLVCPLTGLRFHVSTGEVDRAIPALGYVPGNFYLASRAGNQERGKLAQHYSDCAGIARLVSDILDVADYVDIPGGMDATRTRDSFRFDKARAAAEDVPCAHMSNVISGPYFRA